MQRHRYAKEAMTTPTMDFRAGYGEFAHPLGTAVTYFSSRERTSPRLGTGARRPGDAMAFL